MMVCEACRSVGSSLFILGSVRDCKCSILIAKAVAALQGECHDMHQRHHCASRALDEETCLPAS